MRDPESTRFTILQKAGDLFNTRGYKATSLSEITGATGFTKGAIYRHFESKEGLEKETLLFLSGQMIEKMRSRIVREKTAGDKLRAVLSFFRTYVSDPPFVGGCPLLNVAIESDDAHPFLRREARKLLHLLRDSILRILDNGIKYKQLDAEIDKGFYATLIIASLEGGIMMSKLNGNDDDIARVVSHLEKQIELIEL